MAAKRKSTTVGTKSRAKRKPKLPSGTGRPSAYNEKAANALCTIMAEGLSLNRAIETLKLNRSSVFRWMLNEPQFRDNVLRARDVRAELAYPEAIIDIADDAQSDWGETKNGKPIVNKELVLRSKLRIEARQFHMSRLHRDTWGEATKVDVKHDYSQMTEAERLKKAHELVGLIHEIQRGPELPPPLEYRPEETDEEPQPTGGIGGRLRRL
jgi:hypothetical protein